mmetsp:Transcript_31230/g.30076  ORF Transcript_31230/g.30076 Transcript_31230/m.30076 type:complete len:86 (+) Transcript_31230:76-333(+)|eukprot:CAMPEP_0197826898 /NCGR_PEP_ID=MMETSP1437-20131217/3789_1 /TAXON_ID=49252 ORGANISM="Eucampia antarctica, Strain CCMP1452" /NCGR_SAMPLE_ID=MMETSP1437 /ASSEMBLY_ACC=CAM_ASM_001096 /LENGTH=85 /DNA_ID=CAMNT_0043427533 /DNA_START=76 /DNA_END=333 /DNA_ORIENTATION=-
MGLAAAFIGGTMGTIAHTMNNAMRKVPLSRQPWLHVGYFFVGCWAGNAYVRLEKKMAEDINEIRADKGMPPMVGSGYWMRTDTEK